MAKLVPQLLTLMRIITLFTSNCLNEEQKKLLLSTKKQAHLWTLQRQTYKLHKEMKKHCKIVLMVKDLLFPHSEIASGSMLVKGNAL